MSISNSIAKSRIERDLKEIQANAESSSIIFASQVDDNLFHIEAAFLGPLSTPYENGIFLLDLKFRDDYPVRCFFVRNRLLNFFILVLPTSIGYI
jgi:ubiquitin-protein ligase